MKGKLLIYACLYILLIPHAVVTLVIDPWTLFPCRVSGDVMVRFVWERDGQLIDSSEAMGILQLQLRIAAVEQVHVGEYSCRVELTPQTGGTPDILGPMTAGTLTVLGK